MLNATNIPTYPEGHFQHCLFRVANARSQSRAAPQANRHCLYFLHPHVPCLGAPNIRLKCRRQCVPPPRFLPPSSSSQIPMADSDYTTVNSSSFGSTSVWNSLDGGLPTVSQDFVVSNVFILLYLIALVLCSTRIVAQYRRPRRMWTAYLPRSESVV